MLLVGCDPWEKKEEEENEIEKNIELKLFSILEIKAWIHIEIKAILPHNSFFFYGHETRGKSVNWC